MGTVLDSSEKRRRWHISGGGKEPVCIFQFSSEMEHTLQTLGKVQSAKFASFRIKTKI
jgi:hypothetical protein